MTRCSVLECKNNSGFKNLSNNVSYHRFPKNPYLKEQWITATGRINWMPSKLNCICSEHFAEEEILITKKGYRYINPDVVPTKKIMNYQSEKITSTSPGPRPVSSEMVLIKSELDFEPETEKPCVIKTERPENMITESIEASSTNKSTSMFSTAREKKLAAMLLWTRRKVVLKDLKIKRLQAQNRRLKRRLNDIDQLLDTL